MATTKRKTEYTVINNAKSIVLTIEAVFPVGEQSINEAASEAIDALQQYGAAAEIRRDFLSEDYTAAVAVLSIRASS